MAVHTCTQHEGKRLTASGSLRTPVLVGHMQTEVGAAPTSAPILSNLL